MLSPKLKDLIANLTAPTGLPGWCTPAKATVLAELVLQHRPQLLVEIGVFGGRSFIPMALALQEAALPTAMAYGIDPWSAAAAIEGMDLHDADDQKHVAYWTGIPLAAVHRRCADVMDAHNLWDCAALLQARSENVAHLFAPASIDFLHLDSNHTELVSCRDVTTWLPALHPDGIFIMDDTDWPSQRAARALITSSGWTAVDDHQTYCVYRRT